MNKDFLKTLPQYALPKRRITYLAGLLANVKTPSIKNYLIQHFIRQYRVNMQEAIHEEPADYACFNDFFIRHLKPECRPIADSVVVSPVDGVVSEAGNIKKGQILQAKGRYYSVKEFLAADDNICDAFTNGHYATLYLSPRDYHRIHMPIDATLRHMIYIPGRLFSVQPATARTVPHLFSRNERLIAFFDTPLGLMAMGLVGATIVGAIGTSWDGDIKRSRQKQFFEYPEKPVSLHKGDEMGYFKLGSTVVLMFAENAAFEWQNTIHSGASIRFGQAMV